METKTRTITRHISWRLFSLIPSFFISYFVTESLVSSVVIGAVGGVARLFFHYIHDRIWIYAKWGIVNHIETKCRTIARILTWRLTVFVVTFIASWLIIGSISESLEIGIIDTVVKFICHYIHERSWLCVEWGIVIPRNIADENQNGTMSGGGVQTHNDNNRKEAGCSSLHFCGRNNKKIKLLGSNIIWSVDPTVHFYCLQDNFPAYECIDEIPSTFCEVHHRSTQTGDDCDSVV